MDRRNAAIATIQRKPGHGPEAIPQTRTAYRGAALPSDRRGHGEVNRDWRHNGGTLDDEAGVSGGILGIPPEGDAAKPRCSFKNDCGICRRFSRDWEHQKQKERF